MGDDFGFGRVGREAVGGNALAARCTSGAGGLPGRLAPPFRRHTHPFHAEILRCGSMIYTFYMFCTAKNKNEI